MVLKDLRDKVAAVINESGLPIDAVYYIIKDIYNEIDYIYKQESLAEKQQEDKNNQSKEEKNEIN